MISIHRNKAGNYVVTIPKGRIFIVRHASLLTIGRHGYDCAAYRTLYRNSGLSHRRLRGTLSYIEWLDREDGLSSDEASIEASRPPSYPVLEDSMTVEDFLRFYGTSKTVYRSCLKRDVLPRDAV